MLIGVLKEVKAKEGRVGLTPDAVESLVREGHTVLVEQNAGKLAGFKDADYVNAGARIAVNADECWASSKLIIKVKEPVSSEFRYFRSGLTIFTYLHLASAKPLTEALMSSGVTAYGYETVCDANGRYPLLAPMSRIAGALAGQISATLLQADHGGKGKLMQGVDGNDRAKVLVIGVGNAGLAAAKILAGLGAELYLTDKLYFDPANLPPFGHLGAHFEVMNQDLLANWVPKMDVIIGCVNSAGEKAPHLVSGDLISQMEHYSVAIDIAIDQGGCFQTSRPTTHDHPTFFERGVIHYCVTNMPGIVPRTSTAALVAATLPYISKLAQGLDAGRVVKDGLQVFSGCLVNQAVAGSLNLPICPMPEESN